MVSVQKSGQLKIKLGTAVLKRDTEFFGKMSPFVEFDIGTKKERSKTHKKAGKNPRW